MAFTGLMFLLLSFYSVGQYRYSGGTRFLLLPAAILSVLSGAGVCDLARHRGGRVIAAAVLLGFLVAGAGKPDATGGTPPSPQREHDAVLRWASLVPPNAIVVSRFPFLWENCGRFAVTPEYARGKSFGGVPMYFHFGLANNSDEWPRRMMPLDRVVTADGAICLFRLR
jgi:hypothetical protein